MACTGRYSESWSFASFWCVDSLHRGIDDSGGAANPSLLDSTADFTTAGVKANVGMVLYNVTASTEGPVTAVTANTLTATGVTWDDGDEYRIVTINAVEIATIEHYLDIAASDLHAAMAQSGMCDCTLASWAAGFLEKLNIIDAAAYYSCPCGHPSLSDDMRGRFLEWCSTQLEAIRTGNLELCTGETGADFPSVGWAEQSLSDFAAAKIINNYWRRTG